MRIRSIVIFTLAAALSSCIVLPAQSVDSGIVQLGASVKADNFSVPLSPTVTLKKPPSVSTWGPRPAAAQPSNYGSAKHPDLSSPPLPVYVATSASAIADQKRLAKGSASTSAPPLSLSETQQQPKALLAVQSQVPRPTQSGESGLDKTGFHWHPRPGRPRAGSPKLPKSSGRYLRKTGQRDPCQAQALRVLEPCRRIIGKTQISAANRLR